MKAARPHRPHCDFCARELAEIEQSFDPEADAIGSYHTAVEAIGKRVRNGEPVPEFFLSQRDRGGE